MSSPSKLPPHNVRYRVVDPETAGQRVDNFLLGALKGVPRDHIYRLIRSGQVRVNAGRVRPSYRLQAGDRVRVPPVAAPSPAAVPVDVDPRDLRWLAERILFEDARILVLDKPAGLAVHGGSGIRLGCIEALRVLRPELRFLELVHRLDRGTSGCLLIAKRRSALRTLHEMLRRGDIEKRYLALLMGGWRGEKIEIDIALAKGRRGGEAVVRVDQSGKTARSVFRPIERFGEVASLAEIVILTGRTHQIRVHAAHLGHPVAGDERYGDADFNTEMRALGLRRMFLHASAIGFTWPDGEVFEARASLPPELAAVLSALRPRGVD